MLLGCSDDAKTIGNRSGGFEIGQRDIKNEILKFQFFEHFPIFRRRGAGWDLTKVLEWNCVVFMLIVLFLLYFEFYRGISSG